MEKRLMKGFRDLFNSAEPVVPFGNWLEHIELVFNLVKLPPAFAKLPARYLP